MCQALTIESKEHICVFQLLSENVKKTKNEMIPWIATHSELSNR